MSKTVRPIVCDSITEYKCYSLASPVRQSDSLQMLSYQSNDVFISAWHEPDGSRRLRRSCRLVVAVVQVFLSAVHNLYQVDVVCWHRQLFGRPTTASVAVRRQRRRRPRVLHRAAESQFLSGRRCTDRGRRSRPVDLTVRWRGQAGDAPFHRPNVRPVELGDHVHQLPQRPRWSEHRADDIRRWYGLRSAVFPDCHITISSFNDKNIENASSIISSITESRLFSWLIAHQRVVRDTSDGQFWNSTGYRVRYWFHLFYFNDSRCRTLLHYVFLLRSWSKL